MGLSTGRGYVDVCKRLVAAKCPMNDANLSGETVSSTVLRAWHTLHCLHTFARRAWLCMLVLARSACFVLLLVLQLLLLLQPSRAYCCLVV